MRTDSLAAVTARPLATEEDWWRVRAMLVSSWSRVPLGWNWDIRHWDGWRFHNPEPVPVATLARVIRLWEDEKGDILAAAHPEGAGDVFLEVRPDARFLEPQMLAWAEATLAVDGAVTLTVFDDDAQRVALAESRHYESLGRGGWIRSLDLSTGPLDAPSIAAGYALRTTRVDDADGERMASLLNRTFGRTIHTGPEYRTFMTRSPSFLEALNLVATAPDGSFACHVGITLDAANRNAIVEPVATDPDHRRQGLARALILEGLRRAAELGALTADVETGEREPANALYEACGFGNARHMTLWRRTVGRPMAG